MQTREERREYLRNWRLNNPDKVKAANKRKYDRDVLLRPDRIKVQQERTKKWYHKNSKKQLEYQRNWSRNKLALIKAKIFDKLGNSCVRCGFSDKRALCIDHINGGGFKELKSGSVLKYYKKVLEDESGLYQILCHNCNWIKRHENDETRKSKKHPPI